MIVLHDCTQGSEEWHSLREGLYTGSNAEKFLKHGKIDYALNHLNSFRGNRWTERGHLLEDEAIDLYEQIRQISVLRPGFITNDKYPDFGYSPDAIDSALIEVKCFDEPSHLELIRAKKIDDIPLKVLAQVYFGLTITELPLAYLIPYHPKIKDPKERFKIIEIPPKRAVISNFKKIMLGGRDEYPSKSY